MLYVFTDRFAICKETHLKIMLAVLLLGHWGLIFRTLLLVQAEWRDGLGCVITDNEPKLTEALYIYTMILDFIIMSMTAYTLGVHYGHSQKGQISQSLLLDGMAYFLVA